MKYETVFLILLAIINQLMQNTLDTYSIKKDQQQSHKHSNKATFGKITQLLMFLMVFQMNLTSVVGKETVIVESLATKNDKILAKLLEQTHRYIEYERFISAQTFQCKAILKNQLTKNTPQNITKIELQLDFGQVVSMHQGQTLVNYLPQQMQEIKQIDKILDILNGQCLYYTTSTFIYEYCHKEHVRQFDSQITKAMNAKPQFEDINMGVYNPQQYARKRLKKGKVELTAQQRKTTLPQLSNFEKDYNFLYIEDINHKQGGVQFEESEDGNYVFSNVPIIHNDQHLQTMQNLMMFHCQQKQPLGTFKQINNYALAVDPYTLIYTKKQGKCDRFVSHMFISDQIKYQVDKTPKPIRVYGKYLYGNVEEMCTANWAWQRSEGNTEFDNYLQEGSMILLELYNARQKQQEYHYVTIKKIISQTMVQLDVNLGKSFKIDQNLKTYINKTTIGSTKVITNITKCQLMFKKRLNLKNIIKLDYVNNGIVKIGNQQQQIVEAGDNLGCICKGIVQNNIRIVDFDIIISKHLFLNYYETIINSNTFIYTSSSYPGKQYLLRQCEDFTCFGIKQQNKLTKQNDNNNKQFTDIKKLTRQNPAYLFNSSKNDNFYILSVKNNGIIKLTTKSKDGIVYTYLITQGQIIKMIQFANGTKQIIKQNKFYQNSTQPSTDIYKSFIYIKVTRLSNSRYYGGIWKTRDFTFFPRFTFVDEQILSLQRLSGFAYLRILNLDNLRNKEHMAVVAYIKKMNNHYSAKVKQEADPAASFFLDQSYSINYNYVSGKYCDPPVNKFRKTTVHIKCGYPWFLITKLLEKSPCEYYIEIQTTLLCREGYKQVQESDENLFNRKGSDAMINSGILCHPFEGLFDETPPYLYLKKSVQ